MAAASRVFGVIDVEVNLVEVPDAKPLALKQGEIEFSDVSFAYESGERRARRREPDRAAGKDRGAGRPLGSGKSTLVNLALRFFDPERGKVLIDGQDIKHVDHRRACARPSRW